MSNIAIIGAGPGGLAVGLILLNQGHQVTIYEKDHRVGGRSKRLTFGSYHFDSGPTFFMYQPILREVFERANIDFDQHLQLTSLDPLYTLYFNERTLKPSADINQTKDVFESVYSGAGDDYVKWYQKQTTKFKRVMPILQKPFPNIFHFLRADVLKGAPVLHPFQSVFKYLSKLIHHNDLIHTLSFQAKYLGMASFEAPSVFTILPYLEHMGGLYHVEGGLNQVNETMAQLFIKNGGKLYLNTKVDRLWIEKRSVKGIISDQLHQSYDDVILNADFAYSMLAMTKDKEVKTYHHQKIKSMKYSVSAFMMYLGLDTIFDFDHHSVFFSKSYEGYLKRLMSESSDLSDMSFYMHNPSKIDKTLAPEGHSSIYILVPVPNLDANIDWKTEQDTLKKQVYATILEKTGIDITKHIQMEQILTPQEWQDDFHVYKGAVFNLTHGFNQMLHKRPQNKFKQLKHLYLVGGGTHPGSGLPTIYQSAIITSQYLKTKKA